MLKVPNVRKVPTVLRGQRQVEQYAKRVRRLALFVALLLVAAASDARQPLPRPPAPDTILYNGYVLLVDSTFSEMQAIAIVGDRVMAVGNSEQMRSLAGPQTRVIDLQGSTVMPGLMDNHLHGAGGGPGVDLSRARSVAEVLAAVTARATAGSAGELILSNSDWHEAQLSEQRLPLRDDLDRAAPDHPVVLVRGGHEYILNSAALARFGINERTLEPAGGRISRYAGGRLNGELVDTAKALARLPAAIPRSREEQIADRIAEYKRLNAAGLTTVRHPGISVDDYRLLEEMQKRHLLTMRVNALLRPGGDAAAVGRTLDQSGIQPDQGDEWLRAGGIKLGVDGGFEGGLMRAPYEEPWGEKGTFRGLQTIDTERYTAIVSEVNRRGWRVATHAVGDAAIDLVLAAYERANRERTIVGRRWSIEHAFIGRPDQLPRMKALGVAISAQNHLYLAGPSLVKYWGLERASLTTPVRSYLDAGLPVSSGTDSPVVPFPPLWTLYHFVTRDTITGGVLGTNQRVSRREAIRMATVNNAWLTFEEQTKGSLEAGKLADLIVLSENPLTCSEPKLRDAQVLMTMVGGRIVYEK